MENEGYCATVSKSLWEKQLKKDPSTKLVNLAIKSICFTPPMETEEKIKKKKSFYLFNNPFFLFCKFIYFLLLVSFFFLVLQIVFVNGKIKYFLGLSTDMNNINCTNKNILNR